MTRRDTGCRWRRRGLGLALLLGCLPFTGCSLLLDEFTWLDRAPPPLASPAASLAGP